jgi:hypothetical protein
VPLRADGLPLRAFRSPGSRLAAPICLPEAVKPQWRLSDGGSPLTVARQLRFRTGFPWCPTDILCPLPNGEHSIEPILNAPCAQGQRAISKANP